MYNVIQPPAKLQATRQAVPTLGRLCGDVSFLYAHSGVTMGFSQEVTAGRVYD